MLKLYLFLIILVPSIATVQAITGSVFRNFNANGASNGGVTTMATDIPVSGANNHNFDVGYGSTPCAINTPTVNTTYNDNGTGSNSADDTFTISATGSNTGANYKVDKISPAPTATVLPV